MSATRPSSASPAMPLDALQQWMLSALTAPRGVDAARIDDLFLPAAHIDARASLAIYQRSYILRLRLCLAEQFPATRHALGAALFDDFADEYLRDCPSDSPTLYDLGRRFAGWMEANRPDRDLPPEQREDWIDFMVDLAHYEYTLFTLFDAPGHAGAGSDAGWPDAGCDDAALVLQPCLALARYRYPVAAYYHAVRAGHAPDFPAAAASHLVVLRRGFRTATYPVTPLHFRFLEYIRDQGEVPAALSAIAAFTSRDREAVARSWARDVRGPWLEAGFFIRRPSPSAICDGTDTNTPAARP